MGVLDDVIAESSGRPMKDFYGIDLPSCVTEVMRNTTELCKENLESLSCVKLRNQAWMKRVLHWETLSCIITSCKPENVYLIEEICARFKSPKKWKLDSEDPDDAITGSCDYSNFGTLYSKEYGVYFVDETGKEIRLVERPARM